MEARMPIRAFLAAAALAAAALLVAAAPFAAAAPDSQQRAATPPACKTSGVLVWLANPQGNGAAGSIYYTLRFTNLSGHTCSLKGFPVVSAVTLAGHKIGVPAGRETGKPAKLVKLHAGETANATLRVVSPGVFSPSECHPVTAAGVSVTLPGQKVGRIVPFPFETCARQPSESALTVGPVN